MQVSRWLALAYVTAVGTLSSSCCCFFGSTDEDLELPRQLIPPVANVQVAARVVADATGTAPFAVTLDASGSSDADGTIVKYDWDFDNDGEIDLADGGVSVPHDYPDTGVTTARVRVTDNDGLIDDATTQITVQTPPVAAGTAAQQGTTTTAGFDGSTSTDADGTIESFDWDFDNDGSYDLLDGGDSPLHDYGAFGSFTAGLRVTDNDGLTDETDIPVTLVQTLIPPVAVATATAQGVGSTIADLDGSASSDADGTIEAYDWDFDNDGTYDLLDGGDSPMHDFGAFGTFTIGLRVTDNDGLTDDTTTQVTFSDFPNNPPVAALSANPPSGTAAQALDVTWDASASTDSDGTIVSYDWDMDNDGSFEITNGGSSQQDTYFTSGIKTVGVRVTDDDGATDSTTATCDVNVPPVANLIPNPPSGNLPLSVTWDATGSSDSDGTIVQYDWDLNNDGSFEVTNGGPTQSPAPYTTIGTVTVRVRVTDDDGATSQTSAIATVNGNPPTAALTGTWSEGGIGSDTANWDASASTDSDGTIVQYDWDMDNDGVFELLNGGPTQQSFHFTPGVVTVGVRVTDNDGLADQTTFSLNLQQPPP
jgi:PKD repeat protein